MNVLIFQILLGGALTSARGAISHLWSSFTTTNNSTTTDSSLTESAMEVTETQCVDAQEQLDAMPAGGRNQDFIFYLMPS